MNKGNKSDHKLIDAISENINVDFLRKFECGICLKKYKSKTILREHLKTHSNIKDFLCPICNKEFRRYYSMKCHIVRMHRITSSKKDESGSEIIESTSVGIKDCPKVHQCHICKFSFDKLYRLKNHLTVHSNEKNFICDVCGRAFRLKKLLMVHLKRVHLKVKNHKCNICSYVSFERNDLIEHMRMHTGERSCLCDVCGKSFWGHTQLAAHKQTHRDFTFFCQFCDYKSRKKALLKVHMVKHTQEKNYLCDICHKKFSQKSTLNVHKNTHSDTACPCPICPTVLKTKRYVKIHLRNVHRVSPYNYNL